MRPFHTKLAFHTEAVRFPLAVPVCVGVLKLRSTPWNWFGVNYGSEKAQNGPSIVWLVCFMLWCSDLGSTWVLEIVLCICVSACLRCVSLVFVCVNFADVFFLSNWKRLDSWYRRFQNRFLHVDTSREKWLFSVGLPQLVLPCRANMAWSSLFLGLHFMLATFDSGFVIKISLRFVPSCFQDQSLVWTPFPPNCCLSPDSCRTNCSAVLISLLCDFCETSKAASYACWRHQCNTAAHRVFRFCYPVIAASLGQKKREEYSNIEMNCVRPNGTCRCLFPMQKYEKFCVTWKQYVSGRNFCYVLLWCTWCAHLCWSFVCV